MGRALTRRFAAAAALAGVLVGALAWRAWCDPAVTFLSGEGPPWIVVSRPLELKARYAAPDFARFRRRFTVGPAAEGELRLRARRESQVVLDGRVVLAPGEAPGSWKNERVALLRPTPGEHELLIVVRADPGPAALSAEVRAWGVSTDAGWEASLDGAVWTAAAAASTPRPAASFALRPGAFAGFAATFLWVLPLAGLGAWLSRRGLARPWWWAGAGWLALAALNWRRLAPAVGFDALHHAELARRIWTRGLPGPGETWQSFQAPLYHLLCAPFAALTSSDEALARWMRLPNFACGFLLAGLCARFAALARPRRPDAAAAAGLFGLALAPNLYMSQTPGNEPLAAVLAGLGLVLCLLLREREPSLPEAFLLGGVLGAALLAKTTAVLVLPAGFLLLGPRRTWRWWGTLAAGAFLAGGWWYVRSWVLHGAAFTGGWNASRGFAWTQDPGYRTAGDFLRFGAALTQPVYSGVAGFWDALYSTLWLDGWQSGIVSPEVRPHWSPVWQAAAAWWGLVPTALLAAGVVRAWRREEAAGLGALAAVGTGLAALLWLFLTVPVYATVKASYLLGLAPAAAFLLVEGLPQAGVRRTWAWALLTGWAACSVIAHVPR